MEMATAMPRALNDPVGFRRFVLHPDVAFDWQQGREALRQRDLIARGQRQHLAIAPQRRWSIQQILEP